LGINLKSTRVFRLSIKYLQELLVIPVQDVIVILCGFVYCSLDGVAVIADDEAA